jgi:hypothetical protein
MEAAQYDVEGYLIFNKKYQIHSYSLQYYEQQSLEEIKKWLMDKHKNQGIRQHYIDYLHDLLKKLSRIVASEEAEGIFNADLKRDLQKVEGLLEQLTALRTGS